ncbi:MAG: NFACT RNA binding domain-containing protein [Candidatus Woesearchaeota archaeon]
MDVTLEYTKTAAQNANAYFDKAKVYKKKLQGVEVAVQHTYEKIKQLEVEEQQSLAQAQAKVQQLQQKKEWYEKFRWFFTSNNLLVIGGRDATTNEIIIKKHTVDKDIVFHTDMAGSPFFVIKVDQQQPTPQELQEVAQLTAVYSKAWQMGLGGADVFWVTPQQVTKEAQSGEFLKKGGFMIKGKTNYVTFDAMQVFMRIEQGKVKVYAREPQRPYARINQGNVKSSDAAKKMRSFFQAGVIDDIVRSLPTGGVSIRLVK